MPSQLPCRTLLLSSTAVLLCSSVASATFSIVAVDSVTREVGSVGASCIDTTMSGLRNLRIDRISEIVPGRGAINGQQSWAQAELAKAKASMRAGDSPGQILSMLMAPQNNPQIYQYVIIDLANGHPRDTAFTGATGTNYKNHIIGRDFALAGNCLMGQHVLDSMRNAFVRSKGLPLADRLMAGILGAKFAGADARCLNQGVSSLSAYIRVAKPADSNDLHIAFGKLPAGVEPLAELKRRFDAWKGTTRLRGGDAQGPGDYFRADIDQTVNGAPDRIDVADLTGRMAMKHRRVGTETGMPLLGTAGGVYLVHGYAGGRNLGVRKLAAWR
jgi:uncharacterized Ntn-hydrolase superfamily protein